MCIFYISIQGAQITGILFSSKIKYSPSDIRMQKVLLLKYFIYICDDEHAHTTIYDTHVFFKNNWRMFFCLRVLIF